MIDLKNYIRDVPDYPKPGILFRDITPLWKDKRALKESINIIAKKFQAKKIDIVVGAEARGFIMGAGVAYKLNAGFVPVRKPQKLPYKFIEETYQLEYGTDKLAIHEDAIKKGQRVLVVDDLIATGGTCQAIAKLINRLGGKIVGFAFLVELANLGGREKIKEYPFFSIIKYS